jgi:hypothetical protein
MLDVPEENRYSDSDTEQGAGEDTPHDVHLDGHFPVVDGNNNGAVIGGNNNGAVIG